ncbi:MAG: Peptidase hyicolysin [Gemmatimonadetes bacterium]|nr:Peptidase hyicolysin [Gemmatimonadota bacterium]
MKRILSAGVFLLALGACKDNGTSTPQIVSVTISPDNQTVNVGGTLQLSASTRDDAGATQQNVAGTWQSLTPAVASVSTTGLLTGVAPGTVKVTATVRDKTDTATFTVSSPSATCTSGATMTLGQSATFTGAAATSLCLEGGASGAEYLVLPRFRSIPSTNFLNLSVTSGSITAATGFNPSRSPAPAAQPFTLFAPGNLHRDLGFERVLRERERELAPLAPGARAFQQARRAVRRSVAAAVPATGDLIPLNASTNACTNPSIRTGRVVAVTAHAIVVADTANPAGGMTDAEYTAFGIAFDTLAYPVDTDNFGVPGDVDGNGRAIVFYTRAVNELTPAGSSSYVGGFFYGRDLFPKTNQPGFTGCGGSNYAEMFYMLAADPNGVVNGNKRSKDLISRTSVATLAHEFQHLISASRRLYVLNTNNYDEDVWLNEGMSHIAEELTFYRAAGLTPGQDIDLAKIRASTAYINAFNTYESDNFGRLHEFLVSAESNSPYDSNDGGDDLETRGAIWSFLRYAADRKGGNQQQIWFNLVNSTLLGKDNLTSVLGVSIDDWFRDWAVSVYTDNTTAAAQPIFQQPSWNFRDIFPVLYPSAGTYMLQTRQLSTPVTLSLAAGAGAYLKGAVAAGAHGAVTFTSSTAGFPGSVFDVTVVRIK